jgi:hypothetical protein
MRKGWQRDCFSCRQSRKNNRPKSSKVILYVSISQIILAKCTEVLVITVNSFIVSTRLFLVERHILIQNMYANKILLHKSHSPISFCSLCTVWELIIQRTCTYLYLWIQILPRKKGIVHNSCGYYKNVFFPGSISSSVPRPSHCRGITITLRHTTLRKTPLDEWSDRRRDLYLTTQNPHMLKNTMPPAGFKSIFPASQLPQTHALDLVATGIDVCGN